MSVDRSPCAHPASALLDFYLNGSLEGAEESGVESHLEECPTCARDLDEMAEVTASIQVHRLRSPGRSSHVAAPRRPSRLPAYGLAAGAAVALLAGVVWLARPGGPSSIDLDLGAGLTRDSSAVPAIEPSRGVETVRAVFSAPLGVGPGATAVLVDPSGGTILGPVPLGRPEPPGVHSIDLPVRLLSTPGRYAIVIQGRGDAGAEVPGVRVEFPFDVGPPPPE